MKKTSLSLVCFACFTVTAFAQSAKQVKEASIEGRSAGLVGTTSYTISDRPVLETATKKQLAREKASDDLKSKDRNKPVDNDKQQTPEIRIRDRRTEN